MRQYGLEKSNGSHKKRSHNGNCEICQPDDPETGVGRQRLKRDTEDEVLMSISDPDIQVQDLLCEEQESLEKDQEVFALIDECREHLKDCTAGTEALVCSQYMVNILEVME